MAVFMINICKFDRCGIIFKNLADLIQHIEENHIDNESTLQYNSTKEIENATCLPLSYVLRFYTNKVKHEEDADELVHPTGLAPHLGSIMSPAPASETMFVNKIQSRPPSPMVTTQQLSSPSIVPALSCSPQGSEPSEDLEEDSMLEDSNDSWTLAEEYSSEYILKHGSKMTTPMDGNVEKPFACPVPGCKKRYKNVNGIKYHSKNGHKTDGRIYKNFKCHCGKSYKTSQGLKTHSLMQHGASPLQQHHLADNNNTTMTRIQDGDHQTDVLQVPSSRIKALTLKHIEALGVPVKTFVLSRNRTPPPPTPTTPTTPSNINILAAATCVTPSDSSTSSNVLEISTSLQLSPASTTLSPNGNALVHMNGSGHGNVYVNASSSQSPAVSPGGFPMDGVDLTPPGGLVTPNTPTAGGISQPIGFVHTSSTPIPIPNGGLSSLLTPATSPSCSPASSLSSYHSL